MTLYECARCHAITGVGYTVGKMNLCYDCKMVGTRGYERISGEERSTVTLVRGDGQVVHMTIGIARNSAGAESVRLTPKRAMTLEE